MNHNNDVSFTIEKIIKNKIFSTLNTDKRADIPLDFIETDSLAEVIEKLAILHCRMWYLEDAISEATTNEEIASLKKKIDICFKVKRPKYVEAINRLVDMCIKNEKSLIEDSVKLYKGFENA